MQYTGINFNKSMLAHCRSCQDVMMFIYDASLRDFCAICTTQHELEAIKEAKLITRNSRRHRDE